MKKSQQPANKTEQLVQFRHRDAQRIANVVSQVEGARRSGRKSWLPRAAGGGSAVVKASFVGSWLKGVTKNVTLQLGDQTATANCSNQIVDVLYSNSSRTCFVFPESGQGYTYTLMIPECIR